MCRAESDHCVSTAFSNNPGLLLCKENVCLCDLTALLSRQTPCHVLSDDLMTVLEDCDLTCSLDRTQTALPFLIQVTVVENQKPFALHLLNYAAVTGSQGCCHYTAVSGDKQKYSDVDRDVGPHSLNPLECWKAKFHTSTTQQIPRN